MLTDLMRIVRFKDITGRQEWGVLRDDGQVAVIQDAWDLLSGRPTLPQGVTVHEAITSADALIATGEVLVPVALLAPVKPGNILCVGRNYRAQVDEFDATGDRPPLELFMKPTTSLLHPGEAIVMPVYGDGEADLDAEGELAVMIGTMLRNVGEAEVLASILGFMIAVDVTDRRWQTPTGPPLWMRGKGFDTFCPIGPELVTADELSEQLADPGGLAISTSINGKVVREGSTGQMIRPPAAIISEISRFITILPGTLVLTGAPPLVRKVGDQRLALQIGDVVEASIDGIEPLSVPCIDAASISAPIVGSRLSRSTSEDTD